MLNKLRNIFFALRQFLSKKVIVRGENYNILRDVVLIGVYGNWLVSLLDRLSFQVENLTLYSIQGIGFLLSLISFFLFFFDIGKWIILPIFLTVICISMAIFIEMIYQPSSSIGLLYFWMFGMIFWGFLSYLEIQRIKSEMA